MNDTKHEIGRRIAGARKHLKLTIKELAAACGNFSQSRVSNWEQGLRTPSPDAIKKLSFILNVSPAYLMCLSEQDSYEGNYQLSFAAPYLELEDIKNLDDTLKHLREQNKQYPFAPVHRKDIPENIKTLIAIQIKDKSMEPELMLGGTAIIAVGRKSKPGDIVLAQVEGSADALIRKYRMTRTSDTHTLIEELVPINPDWPSLRLTEKTSGKIIGVLLEYRLTYSN